MKTLPPKKPEFVFDPSKKMDIRDLFTQMGDDQKAYDWIMARLIDMDIETPPDTVEEIQCSSFNELISIFRKNLKFWPQKNSDALAVATACIISIRIKGPLLWTYLIGPSGCGKTTICEALGADRIHTLCKDQMTSLHSGWRPSKDEDGKSKTEDVSLLAKLRNKALIIKDFTSVMNQSPQSQEKLFGEMRHAYDGVARTHYANEVEHEYEKINFPLVAGVTHVVHSIKKSALGERFIKVDMSSKKWDGLLISCVNNVSDDAAASVADPTIAERVDEQHSHSPILKGATLGFVRYTFQRLSTGVSINTPDWFREKIVAMALLVAASRADVQYTPGQQKELAYRPVLEVGSHMAGQLAKLAICLAVVLDRQPDVEVFRIVKKVAWDTAYGFTFDVIRALAQTPYGEGLSKAQICRKARVSRSVVDSKLRDLMELGCVYKDSQELVPSDQDVDGRVDGVYYLSDDLRDAWELIEGPSIPIPTGGLQAVFSPPEKSEPPRKVLQKLHK